MQTPDSSARHNPKEIERILALKGAFGFCYAITEHPDLDGKDISLKEALEKLWAAV
jgi:hypothetical protein